MSWVPGDDFPLYQEYGADEGNRYPEVAAALTGAASRHRAGRCASTSSWSRSRCRCSALRATVGVLLLSTEPGDIDSIVAPSAGASCASRSSPRR